MTFGPGTFYNSISNQCEIASSAPIVGSGSIVGSVTSASLMDLVRATLHFARFRLEHRAAARRASKHALPLPGRSCPPALAHTLAHTLALTRCAHRLMVSL